MVRGQAWPEFDASRIRETLPRLAALVAALVRRYGMASATQAAAFYQAERAAQVPGRVSVPVESPPSLEQVTQELKWATDNAWGVTTPEDMAVMESKVVAAAERMTLDVGRDTIVAAVAKDRYARGWARVTEPGACHFCLMLATRGAVYKNKAAAGVVDAKTALGGDAKGEANRYHDNCRCHVEPLFGGAYEPTAQVRAAQQLWEKYAAGKPDPLNAFRRALSAARNDGHPLL